MALFRFAIAAVAVAVVRADYWAFSSWIKGGHSNSSAGCMGSPDEVIVQLQGCMRSASLPTASWSLRCFPNGTSGALVEFPDSTDCGAKNGRLSLATAFNVLDCAALPAEDSAEPNALSVFRKRACTAISVNSGANVEVLDGAGPTCWERTWGQYRRECVAGEYAAPLATVTTTNWVPDAFVGDNSCGAAGSVIDAQTLGAPTRSLVTPQGGCFIPFNFQKRAVTSSCNDVATNVTYVAFKNMTACLENNRKALIDAGGLDLDATVPAYGCKERSLVRRVISAYSRSTCTVEPYGPPNAQEGVSAWGQFGRNPAHSFKAVSAAPLLAPSLKWRFRYAGAITASPSLMNVGGTTFVSLGDDQGYFNYINTTSGASSFGFPGFNLGYPIATTFASSGSYGWYDSFVVFSVSTDPTKPKMSWTITDSGKHKRNHEKRQRNKLSGNWEAPSLIITSDLSTLINSYANSVLASTNDETSSIDLWETDLPDFIVSTPALSTTSVFVGCNDHRVYALELMSGVIVWASDVLERNVTSSPTYMAEDNSVYVSNSNKLYAFNAADGSVRWVYEHEVSTANQPLIEGLFMQSSPVVVGQYVVWANTDGTIISVHRTNGKFGWRFDEPSCSSSRSRAPAFYATPAVDARGLVIVGATNGILYAIDGYTGRKAWAFDTTPRAIGGGAIFSSATIDANGDIYVGAGKTLVALKRSPLKPSVPSSPKSPKSPGGKSFRRSRGGGRRSVAELPAPDSAQELLGAPAALALGGSFLAGATTAAAAVGAVLLMRRK